MPELQVRDSTVIQRYGMYTLRNGTIFHFQVQVPTFVTFQLSKLPHLSYYHSELCERCSQTT